MSFSRFLVLHEIKHAKELTQSELQQRLGMEGALVTRFVKQMEKSGLISRRVDPNDNRFMLVALTPAGHALLEKMKSLREKSEAVLLDGVSKQEQKVMVAVIKRIQENISSSQRLVGSRQVQLPVRPKVQSS